MKYILQFFKWLMKGATPHTSINQKLDTALDDKLRKRREEQQVLIQEHNEVLNSFLRTYFSKQYISNKEMAFAFSVSDRQWKRYVREVNSTTKLINLNKNDFKHRVMKTLSEIANSKNQKQKTNE